jgi:short-subunit dehydrogenase
MKTDSKEHGTVLITGAASGIGRALATEFAKNGHPLIIHSRQPSELEALASELSGAYNIDVKTIAANLEESTAPKQIFDFVISQNANIDIMANNAGHGHLGNFWEIPLSDQVSMLRVNIEAVVRLTHLFLPQMVQKRRGRILNTASIAGFEPGPTLAVYHATKAFVLSFTEALATELENTGITVTALCPGATDTDFMPKAQMVGTKAFQKGAVMSPQEVAEIGYKACMNGDRTVVAGAANKALVFARRFMTEEAQAKLNQKFYEKVPPADRKRTRGDVEAKHRMESVSPGA